KSMRRWKMRRNVNRNEKCEGRALAQLAHHFNPAAHQFDSVLDDRQAQTGSPHLPRPRPVYPIKPLEYTIQILFRNAGTSVGYVDFHKTISHPYGIDTDFAARMVKFDRVI